MADTDSKPSTVDKAVDKVTDAFKDMKSHLPTSSNPDDQVPQTEGGAKPKKEKKPKAPKPAPVAAPMSPALIDLRVGHILRCVPHENADSLYVSTIDMGDREGAEHTHKDDKTGKIVRTVCSGLKGLVPLEEMQDRKVVVVANLKPASMRGIKSAAMVLAASPKPAEGQDPHSADRVVELVEPPKQSKAGEPCYFEGWMYGEGKGPEKQLNPKKRVWETIQPGFFTSDDLQVGFQNKGIAGMEPGGGVGNGGTGMLVCTSGGYCQVKSLKEAAVR